MFPSSVPAAFLLAASFLLLHTDVTLARTLGLQSDNLTNLLSKRNSWWSKKSVDMTSDFTPVVPGKLLSALDGEINSRGSFEERNSDAYRQLYGCYTASCVPDFIGCAARSRTTGSFDVCKLEHRACARRCWDLTQDLDSAMK